MLLHFTARGPCRPPVSPTPASAVSHAAILQSCGVDTVLTEEAVEEGEVDALRQSLDSQAQEVRRHSAARLVRLDVQLLALLKLRRWLVCSSMV